MRALRLVRGPLLLGGLVVAVVASVLLGAGIGAVDIPARQVIAVIAGKLGLDLGITVSPENEAILWAIRLPRVALGLLVGAGLAVAGATLQGIFRNPLADPGLIGVSSGASLGAVGAIVLGLSGLGAATLPVAAFAGALVATFAVYALARFEGRTEVVTLLLTGLAVNAIAGAGIGYLVFQATDSEIRDAVFWTLGSLGGATWTVVLSAAPFVLLGVFLMPAFARELNLLILGEREAAHLGVATERLRVVLIALVALTTGAAVAVAGTIGFIGLIVPHLVRLAAGPDNRIVLPASALAGAALLVFADLLARTAAAPAELPIGVITSLIGGPFFLWLLHRTRRAHGGWG
ncbi:MAG TPA: iron chelate uptake ABC transporter family permease subunit [Gaiellaceae bacterium]|jgi:iron complex transport system permease protein